MTEKKFKILKEKYPEVLNAYAGFLSAVNSIPCYDCPVGDECESYPTRTCTESFLWWVGEQDNED